jgi:hypothetical protein
MLSSRRFVDSERLAVQKAAGAAVAGNGVSTAVKVMLAGLLVLMGGAALEVDLLMAAGFLALATSGLYLNGQFWVHMEEKGFYKPGSGSSDNNI